VSSDVVRTAHQSYVYDVKFLALLVAPYIYDITRLRVKFNEFSTTGPTRCTVCCQFITVNSLYVFRALACLSSGGTVCTAIGIFCVLKFVELFKITYVHCY
jgi:hypothetical protein